MPQAHRPSVTPPERSPVELRHQDRRDTRHLTPPYPQVGMFSRGAVRPSRPSTPMGSSSLPGPRSRTPPSPSSCCGGRARGGARRCLLGRMGEYCSALSEEKFPTPPHPQQCLHAFRWFLFFSFPPLFCLVIFLDQHVHHFNGVKFGDQNLIYFRDSFSDPDPWACGVPPPPPTSL